MGYQDEGKGDRTMENKQTKCTKEDKMEELTKQEEKGITVPVTTQTIKDFLFSSGTKLSEQQQAMFMQLATRNQLDPFKREIYAIAYGSNFNIVTGYQLYIQRSEASGKLDGW